jgi:hypothetical protein
MFGAAAIAYFVLCALGVPLLVVAAGRLKFFAWQIAIVSLTSAVVVDNIRQNAIHRSEIPSVAFGSWALGTLFSSPLPLYFILRPLTPRQKYIVGLFIGGLCLALWLGLEKITR